MAIRPDRVYEMTDGSHKLSDVASKGVVLVYSTSASGVGLGDSQGIVALKANPSGFKVAGVLLQDFVSIDETRFHINHNKEEQNVGDNCDMLTKGWLVTNKVIGTPSAEGVKAYLTSSGCVTPTLHTTGGTVATPYVGEFGGTLDENGYVKLKINLPNAG